MKEICIADKKVGNNNPCYIIAEAGSNHNGDFEIVKKLIDVLNSLVDKGNSVVVIEHNPDVIKSADYIIDLGPDGGENGGEIVAAGLPEEISENPRSYTGEILKSFFKGKKKCLVQ